jgi:2-dehydropantoate 2-reductase
LSLPTPARIVRDMGPEGRVLVAGAGAVGSVVGGLLAAAGWDVTLLARRTHAEAVRTRGLVVEGLFGTHHVQGLACVTDAASLREPFGTILLTVKTYDTAATASAVAPCLADDGVLLSLQNGLGNIEAAGRAVGDARVLGGRVIFGAELVEPGRARVTVYADPVLVGSPDPADSRRQGAAVRWAAHLAAAGIPAEASATIVAELWAKVLYSAALNPVGALLGVPYGALAADPDTRAIMDAVIDEVFAVAGAEGVRLRWPDAAAYREEFYRRLVPVTSAHRSSMLQDIERGRPTEVDAINGWVASRAAAHGLDAPTNALLVRLVRARAARREETSCNH